MAGKINKSGRKAKTFSRERRLEIYHEVVNEKEFREVMKVMVQQAKDGDRDLQKYIADRDLGRIAEAAQGDGETPIHMTVYIPQRRERTGD